MRVFLTGASGFIGAGIGRALIAAGHEVLGLARSECSADRLRAAGIKPLGGDLSDPQALAAGAASTDATIHAGFPRDAYDQLDQAIRIDTGAIQTLRNVLVGTSKRLVYTSGIGVVGDTEGKAVTEDEPLHTPPGLTWRRELELAALEFGGIAIRPAFVYGGGGGAILVTLIRDAVARGYACYAEPGTNAWPNVHVDDLGRGYVQALEKAPPASVFNLAADQSTPAAVFTAIGKLVGAPQRTRALPLAEASEMVPYIGWLQGDIRIDSTRARTQLGWRPAEPGIIHEIEHGSYRELLDTAKQPESPHP